MKFSERVDGISHNKKFVARNIQFDFKATLLSQTIDFKEWLARDNSKTVLWTLMQGDRTIMASNNVTLTLTNHHWGIKLSLP